MKKKKKIMIAVSTIIGILICASCGTYIWYLSTPFPTMVKLMSAVQEKNMETLLECIEPQTAQTIRLFINLTGASGDEILEKVYLSDITEHTYKLSDYTRDGNAASVKLFIFSNTEESEDPKNTIELNFVRLSGTWYLSLSNSIFETIS